MPSNTDAWGIEVGAGAIKAVRLQRTSKDIVLTDHDVIPHKKVLTTPDLDVDETIRLGLDQFLTRHAIGNAAVAISVPAHMAFARFAKLPPVEPKRIPDIVRFEAVQQIPFPIEQVEWDYQIFDRADSPDVEVGIFAITQERVNDWIENFRSVGIPVHGVTLASLGVFNALRYDLDLDEDAPGTIIMDIGATATDLIIVDAGHMWLRTIPIGGHHFTETLVRSFKLSYSKAESIKRDASNSKYARQIFQAMRPVFVELVNEVQKSLGYYHSLQRDADLKRLVGLGNTFRLPGLQKFLNQQLQIDVVRLDRFKKIGQGGEAAEQALNLATAYGLALQGLEAESVSCNILPRKMVQAQVWRRKQPWLVAASVVVAACAGYAWANNAIIDRGAFQSNEGRRDEITRVISQAQTKVQQWNSLQNSSDPRAKIENMRLVLEYRDVWPSVLAQIQNAVAAADPQPELLSGDPELVKSIPRTERRLIYINSIESEYREGSAEAPVDPVWKEDGVIQAEVAQQASPGAGAIPEYMSMGGPGQAALEQLRQTGRSQAGPGQIVVQRAELPPSYHVTIEGRTTRADAARFIDQTIVRYLKSLAVPTAAPDPAEQPTGAEAALAEAGADAADAATATEPAPEAPRRSYRIADIRIEDISLVDDLPPIQADDGTLVAQVGRRSMADAGMEARVAASRAAQESIMPSGGQGRTEFDASAILAARAGLANPTGPSLATETEQLLSIDLSAFEPYLPRSPFRTEDTSTDSKFRISFRVELVLPGDSPTGDANEPLAGALR